MPFILNPYWFTPPPPLGCTVAFGFDEAPVERLVNDGPYVLGWHFTTDFDRKVTRIGIYKPRQGGVNQPTTMDHSVGIWDFTNYSAPTLLWQQDFLVSGTCVPDDNPIVTPYYCWFDITDGPDLYANIDYVVAATWDEFSPVEVPREDVDIITEGFKMNETAITQQGAVPGMLIDLASEPYYAPTINTPPQKGFLTVNLCLTRL